MNIITNAVETGVPNVSINLKTNIDDLALLPEVPCQRDHERRVARMNKHFVKNVKSIHTFTVFHVIKDLVIVLNGERVFVKKGWYLGDGNTRLLSYKQLNDPNHRAKIGYNPTHPVVTKIVTIKTEQELLDEYYSIDNSAATENSGDLIRGAIKLLGINLTTPKGKSGAFGSALNQSYPGDSKDTVVMKVAYFRKELELLDQCSIFNTTESDLQTQHFYCASLIAAKLYSEPSTDRDKLVGLLKDLSRIDFDGLKTSKDKWNGMTYLVYQAVMPNKHCKIYDDELHKSTKFASWDPVVSFMLFCFDNHMNNKLIHKKNGIRPSTSQVKGKLQGTKNLLEQLYPTS